MVRVFGKQVLRDQRHRHGWVAAAPQAVAPWNGSITSPPSCHLELPGIRSAIGVLEGVAAGIGERVDVFETATTSVPTPSSSRVGPGRL